MSDEWERPCHAIRNPAGSAKVFEASMVTKNIEKFAALTRRHVPRVAAPFGRMM